MRENIKTSKICLNITLLKIIIVILVVGGLIFFLVEKTKVNTLPLTSGEKMEILDQLSRNKENRSTLSLSEKEKLNILDELSENSENKPSAEEKLKLLESMNN